MTLEGLTDLMRVFWGMQCCLNLFLLLIIIYILRKIK